MEEHLLPFAQGTRVIVTQGNGGSKSHNPGGKAHFAFDFVPEVEGSAEGFIIVAAASGTVAHIKEDSSQGGDNPAFIGLANRVVITHGNGFCDAYLHLQHRSVTNVGGLSVGDQVVRGQPIAAVGSTGWSTAPHLHFQHQHCAAGTPPTIPCTGSYFQQSVPMTFADVDVRRHNGVPRLGETYVSDNGPASLHDNIAAAADLRADRVMLEPARRFMQFAQQRNLGAPLSQISRQTGLDGLQYYVQVFELDTIYLRTAPAGGQPNWGNIARMTDLIRPLVPPFPHPGGDAAWWSALAGMIIALTEDSAHRLALWLWSLTYETVGMNFNDRQAAYWYVLGQVASNHLGAPLGSAVGGDPVTAAGTRYYVMAHARDAIYWEHDKWREIHRLSEL